MTTRLKKHIGLFKVINEANPRLRKVLLKHIDNNALRCLCDCAHNLLNGNLPLSPRQLKQLKRYKAAVRQLGSKGLSLKNKRTVIQRGGIIGAILTPLLTLAVSLLADKWMGK